jgi:hypothetical protein
MSKLFIYIPTYNRPEALKSQLNVLIPQVLKFSDDVRLMVNENGSDLIYQENIDLLNGHFNIEYRVNCGNIEGNANIALGFIFARPNEFIWILSDNDIISDTALEYILSELDSTIDFYCFNYSVENPTVIGYKWEDGWETPMEWRFGLISDGLYNSNSVKDSLATAFYYHNTSFPHLAVSCATAKRLKNVKFKLLPRDKINNSFYNTSKESPTDYTVAQVGFPLILPLFPSGKAKSFARKWLLRHGIDFYKHKKKRYNLYLQSKATLSYYGGYEAKLLLAFMRVISVVGIPYISIRQYCIERAKEKFSEEIIEKLKNIRRIIWGK